MLSEGFFIIRIFQTLKKQFWKWNNTKCYKPQKEQLGKYVNDDDLTQWTE